MPSERNESFSKKHGFHKKNPPVEIWEDAPQDFRFAVLQLANEDCGIAPSQLRDLICKVLRKQPDTSNWSEFPNIWEEVKGLFRCCDWYCIYDIIERIADDLDQKQVRFQGSYRKAQDVFEEETNQLMAEFGIGWKLEDGIVQARGEESYEAYLQVAEESLQQANKPTALTELKEAIRDVSRRPVPDTSGAIQHAMASLECVVRDVANDPKPTLGRLMQKHPDLFPKPIDDAVEKLWGYASENARHGREGNDPTREEAMLLVGIAATLTNYLIHKMGE